MLLAIMDMWFSCLLRLMRRISLIEIWDWHVRCKLCYLLLFFSSRALFTSRKEIRVLWFLVFICLVQCQNIFEILLSFWSFWTNFNLAPKIIFYVFLRQINWIIKLIAIVLASFDSCKLVFLYLFASTFILLLTIIFASLCKF